MSTLSNSSHLFSPLRDPESLIRRRNLDEPSSLFDFEEVMNNNHNLEPPPQNGPPPIVRPNGQAPRTMEELCQPSINGRGGSIASIPIQATDFGLRHHMIQQVQNTCQFHRLPVDDADRHIDKFLEITQHNEVSDDALHLSLFPYSLTHHAIDCYRDTINAAAGGTFMQKTQCYELIENMTAHHNHWDTSAIRDETSRNISSTSTTESPKVVRQLEMMNKNFSEMMRQFKRSKLLIRYMRLVVVLILLPRTGSLPSNTVPNPWEDIKAITTRNYVTLAGPSVSPPFLSKEVDREPETITNQVLTGSTNNVPPLVVQPSPASTSFSTISSSKMPEVKKDMPKPTIPYPSRFNKQKLREKDENLALKFVEIFRNLYFELSFTYALLHMPKFALMFKSLLNNKEKLFDLDTTSVNENCSAVILKKLPKKLKDPDKFLNPCDFLEFDECLALADLDRSTTQPAGIAEDVFVKVGKYHFSIDFVVVDYVVDPRVPLILRRSFLRTGRALIDVYCEELTLRVDDEAITFKSGNPIPISNPIIALSSPSLTPFELLNDDPSLSPLPPKELNVEEIKTVKSSIDEPSKLELKDLPSHLEYAYLDGTDKLPVIIAKSLKDDEKEAFLKDQEKTTFTCPYGTFAYRRMPFGLCNAPGTFQSHKISKNGLEFDRAKVDVIAKLPPPTTVKGVRSFLGHAGFYRRFIQDFSKIARPMTHLLEKETSFVFSKDCIDGFETLKKKLTEAPILVVPNWNLPFELMCNASDFAIGAVLGQRKTKHFQPIHYASKTMTEAQIHYTTMEKEMLSVVYAFEKFQPYLVLSKSIVYTDHSTLKYLLNKQVSKPRLIRWVLLLQEFDIIIRDKKGTENLAADHLSRLENPHMDVLENNDINKNFLLETLGKISSESTPWTHRGHRGANFTAKKVFDAEVSNRGLKCILKRTVGENRASWSKKLEDALWAFRTAYKTPNGCTPYKLVYGKSCHLPIELDHKAYWALKHANFDLKTMGDHRKLQLNELNELRDQAYENSLIYKEKMKKLHDSKIKNRIFNVGDRVLLFNSRLKIFSRKLKTHWTRPFTVAYVFPYGTIELSQADGPNFKVNGHRLKHYFGGHMP
nr:hypothetical protein [Tanacetum cinerariifolium]